MKILNKLNQLASKLPTPLAKLFGLRVPKPFSIVLLALVGWPLLLTVLFLFWLIPYMIYSKVDLFFYLKDYTMLNLTDFFILLGALYSVVLLWYWKSKNKSLQKLVKIMLFILYFELVAFFLYEVCRVNYLNSVFNEITGDYSETDVEYLKWQYNNRDVIALEMIRVYVEAIYKTLAVTAVAIVSWLFFGKKNNN